MKLLFKLIAFGLLLTFGFIINADSTLYLFPAGILISFMLSKKSVKFLINIKFLIFCFVFVCLIPLFLGEKESQFIGFSYSHFYLIRGANVILRGTMIIMAINVFSKIIDMEMIINKLGERKGVIAEVMKSGLSNLSAVSQELNRTYAAFILKNGKFGILFRPVRFLAIVFINMENLVQKLTTGSENKEN